MCVLCFNLQVYEQVKVEFKLRGAYIMTPEQCKQAGQVIIKDGRLNADIVGQKATTLAALFGFSVPSSTRVLIGEVEEIGQSEPMSYEKLCPVLGEQRAQGSEVLKLSHFAASPVFVGLWSTSSCCSSNVALPL